jgi:hypothetical protein
MSRLLVVVSSARLVGVPAPDRTAVAIVAAQLHLHPHAVIPR